MEDIMREKEVKVLNIDKEAISRIIKNITE